MEYRVSSVRQMSCIVAMLTSKHKVTPDWCTCGAMSTDAPITNLFYAILLSNSLVSRRLGYFSAGYWTFGFAIPVPAQNVQKWDY